MTDTTYKVVGMHCASCSAVIEKTIKKQVGVRSVSVNYGTEEAWIDFDAQRTSIQNLSTAIEPLGYRLQIVSRKNEDETETNEQEKFRNKIIVSVPLAVVSVFIMSWELLISPFKVLPAMPIILEEFFHHLLPIMATYMLFKVGTPYIRGVLTFIKYHVANMDALVGVGSLTAFIYSFIITAFEAPLTGLVNTSHTYYDVVIVVIALITLGKYLELKAKGKTGDAIKKLLGLQAKTALVVRGVQEVELPLDQVVVGDVILVRPGMKIPVDGIILEGASNIDEAMLTGEPMPVSKKINDHVSAGTMNTTGSFTMRASGVGSATVLARIIKMVGDAQGSKAPIQRMADKISAVFVPIVLVLALITLLVWLVVGSYVMGFSQALSFALVCFVSILVIACPCALGLATPTAIMVGVGKGATNGILIKNAEILEKLYTVTTVVVDKTGTLTQGKPKLVSLKSLSELDEKTILTLFASLEKNSEHPVAHCIVEAAGQRGIRLEPVSEFQNLPGLGVKGVVNGTLYYVGSLQLAALHGLKIGAEYVSESVDVGRTLIMLSTQTELLAIASVGDDLKPETAVAIKQLQALGIKIVMATGDHKNVAEFFAKKLGIDEIVAGVLPEDKLQKIKDLQSNGEVVAMAGDGVNDAPALAQADVGIAMSTGTDVAIETGDVTLLKGDITKIAEAITLSRRTMQTIKQNLFWAFIYNVIGIPLASGIFFPLFGWLLSPVFAGLAMAFSSVSVVTNSLRLKTKKL